MKKSLKLKKNRCTINFALEAFKIIEGAGAKTM